MYRKLFELVEPGRENSNIRSKILKLTNLCKLEKNYHKFQKQC